MSEVDLTLLPTYPNWAMPDPDGRCQVCGAPHAVDDPVLCDACGEPVLHWGWAP